MPSRHRWRWGLIGLLISAVYILADLLLEWRGQRYLPWGSPEAIAYNVGMMPGSVAILSLVAFLLGYAKDRAAARKAAAPAGLPPANDSAPTTDWYLFVDDVEYGPLSTTQLIAHTETHGLSNGLVW